jgi:dUTP pyrophosphatase
MNLQYKLTEKAKEIEQDMYYAGEGLGYARTYPDCNFAPRRATDGSVGYDLSACLDNVLEIKPNTVVKVPTGVCIWLDTVRVFPNMHTQSLQLAGLLMSRSSLKGLQLTNSVGLIDGDYQGELLLSLHNYTKESVFILPGARIAQLVITVTYVGNLLKVNEFSNTTARGENGFGSTGV